MSTLSKLFSGYTGGGHVAKNGKFSTTKNNHNRKTNGYPTVDSYFSVRLLKQWAKDKDSLPSYLNPIYHCAYHKPKRTYR